MAHAKQEGRLFSELPESLLLRVVAADFDKTLRREDSERRYAAGDTVPNVLARIASGGEGPD